MSQAMGWKKGDLGRFKSEDPKRPRFEFLGVNKKRTNVGVFYGGLPDISTIPIEVFRKDCVNWWNYPVSQQKLPSWIVAGATFQLEPEGRHLTQAVIPARTRWEGYHTHTIEALAETLRIRSVRHNYASCVLVQRKLIVLLSIEHIMSHAYRERTAWDRLEDDPFDAEDEDLLLFDGM